MGRGECGDGRHVGAAAFGKRAIFVGKAALRNGLGMAQKHQSAHGVRATF
jgi:hypothetical protein